MNETFHVAAGMVLQRTLNPMPFCDHLLPPGCHVIVTDISQGEALWSSGTFIHLRVTETGIRHAIPVEDLANVEWFIPD